MNERIEAHLVYDTREQPLTPGVRAVVQRARRVLYAADETELVLQIAADRQPDRLKLAGQVLDEGMPIEGAAVNLHGPTSRVEQETDEDGEFQIGSLQRGEYSLEIDTPARQVSVAPLEIE
jgi:carboxypeptidase family protein